MKYTIILIIGIPLAIALYRLVYKWIKGDYDD
jgi:hypothetical protein